MLTPPSPRIAGPPRAHWTPAVLQDCPYGVLVCATCPGEVPANVLDGLHLREREHASTLPEGRSREWIGGRLCLAAALASVPALRVPLLPLPSGAPAVPEGHVGSISHKGPLALALAAKGAGGIGIDVECMEISDEGLADRVLTSAERSTLGRIDSGAGFIATTYFAAKEAIYKAMPAREQPAIDFEHIELVSPLRRAGESNDWMTTDARVSGRNRGVRVAVFLDGDWVIAAARRK